MEAEERPMKVRKLGHGANDQQPSQSSATLLESRPSNVVGNDEEPPQSNEQAVHATETEADSSSAQGIQPDLARSMSTSVTHPPVPDHARNPGPSKTQLKKLRKKQEWEAGREARKLIRKQKQQEKKARKRAARGAMTEGGSLTEGEHREDAPATASRDSLRPGASKHAPGTLLPITLIIDCAFDQLMHERERISLASQITRSYSDNHRAPFKAHLVISSWGGELKIRFDTVLSQDYLHWKGVRVLEEDFMNAAERSKEWMSSDKGGKLVGAFGRDADRAQAAELAKQGEVVYLTSDSENTLDRLKPYSTYIIGGLVDKNRHKGICYKSARDRGVKTAKLPIGEYMDMQSRYVLATNHVVEIIVRWLECGDWGEAFLKVMPKRKGGKLKQMATTPNGEKQEQEQEEEQEIGPDTGGEDEYREDGEEGENLDEAGTEQATERNDNSAAVPSAMVEQFGDVVAAAEDG